MQFFVIKNRKVVETFLEARFYTKLLTTEVENNE